ncbi:MAG: hypothetical protein ACI4CT_01795 [Lachnospiraceae bacterium]
MRKMTKRVLSFALAASMILGSYNMPVKVSAEDYSVTVKSIENRENRDVDKKDSTFQYAVSNENINAYLWVPENVKHISGVVMTRVNLIEPYLAESTTIREACEANNLGVVYFFPQNSTKRLANKWSNSFIYDEPGHAGETLDEMMGQFAATSGFDELRYAPIIAVTHSTALGTAYNSGAWDPNRIIAQVAMKSGGNTSTSSDNINPSRNNDTQPGVPLYFCNGQFTEHGAGLNRDNYINNQIDAAINDIRSKGTNRLITMSVEWEAGHYDWSEESNIALADYINRACFYRLGQTNAKMEAEGKSVNDVGNFDENGKLKEDYKLIDLTETGFVASSDMFGDAETKLYNKTSGVVTPKICGSVSEVSKEDQLKAFWFMDKEQFEFIRDFTAERKTLNEETQVKKARVLLRKWQPWILHT